MKILVPIKRVIDYNVVVQIQSDHQKVVTDHVKMSVNPFDEIALEEAIRFLEAGKVKEVIVVSIGSDKSEDQLRHGLAMGANRSILVSCADEISNDPLCVAKILAAVVEREQCELVFMGKQAIDNDCNQTGQMLAGLLNWGQATFASEISLKGQSLEVAREIDGGTETIKVSIPAIVTADLRLNQPRYTTLPNIMMSKQKPLERLSLQDLDLKLEPYLKRLRLDYPEARKSGEVFHDVDLFLKKLDEDGVCN
ncbi:MAG: electron transfer flavoprotein subunit beta/FixA family protein [Pseudomonadota bacterium]|nr:electron transfer flavoprotein subunit beta/FixA family protein [Pseudomonadota bacterium]